MNQRPGFHPDAKLEMREAESAPVSIPPVRKHEVERFPFSVMYSVRDGGIFVSAVAHYSRRPYYWKDRL